MMSMQIQFYTDLPLILNNEIANVNYLHLQHVDIGSGKAAD